MFASSSTTVSKLSEAVEEVRTLVHEVEALQDRVKRLEFQKENLEAILVENGIDYESTTVSTTPKDWTKWYPSDSEKRIAALEADNRELRKKYEATDAAFVRYMNAVRSCQQQSHENTGRAHCHQDGTSQKHASRRPSAAASNTSTNTGSTSERLTSSVNSSSMFYASLPAYWANANGGAGSSQRFSPWGVRPSTAAAGDNSSCSDQRPPGLSSPAASTRPDDSRSRSATDESSGPPTPFKTSAAQPLRHELLVENLLSFEEENAVATTAKLEQQRERRTGDEQVQHPINMERTTSTPVPRIVIQQRSGAGGGAVKREQQDSGTLLSRSATVPGTSSTQEVPHRFTGAQYEARRRIVRECTQCHVEERTINWFCQPEHAPLWENLANKCEELSRRMQEAHTRVKNPSAWLTKFFNVIRRDGPEDSSNNMAGPRRPLAEHRHGHEQRSWPLRGGQNKARV